MAPFYILDPVHAAKEAISEDLCLPKPASDGRINTLNNRGAMKFNFFSKTASKFIDIAIQPGMKVLDIGAAFGEVAMEALRKGAMDYTAIDLDEKHLKILARRVYEEMPEKMSCLKLIHGGIPNGSLFKENEFDAILADSVLHFLNAEQIFQVE
uniref:Methyltransferase domain-containing protein n=1 Tax=Acrobeloides nanus TaxID=290746 RepID=A0A914EBV7_9BILA